MSQDFIDRIAASDPSQRFQAEIAVDTNVIGEIYTMGDMLKLANDLGPENSLESTTFRWRQRRARSSILLAWYLAKARVSTGMLGNEAYDIIVGRLAPESDSASFAMTAAFAHIVRPLVFRAWPIGAFVEVNHNAIGNAADDEILRIAGEDKLPVITWEAYREDGTFSDEPKKLRNRCKAKGVSVYTPQEFLAEKNQDETDMSRRFIFALEKAVREARAKRILEGKDVVDLIIPTYRFVLFDEVDAEYAHVKRPA